MELPTELDGNAIPFELAVTCHPETFRDVGAGVKGSTPPKIGQFCSSFCGVRHKNRKWHGKIRPKVWQVAFVPWWWFRVSHFFRVVSGDYGKPCFEVSESFSGLEEKMICNIWTWHFFVKKNRGFLGEQKTTNMSLVLTRWWQLKCLLIFIPKIWGNDPIWLAHMFQRGWFKTT